MEPELVVDRAAAGYLSGCFTITSFGIEIGIDVQARSVCFTGSTEKPVLAWQLLCLHYLLGASETIPCGEIKPFRELEGGLAYSGIFEGRTTMPLLRLIDSRDLAKESMMTVLAGFNATVCDLPGDISVSVPAFAKVPIYLTIWLGDEELPSTASIYFDRTITDHLPTEDAVVLAELFSMFLRAAIKEQSA